MATDSNVKHQVKQLLLQHQGSDNPITSREINEHIDVDNIGSFPSTRAIIRDIVLEDRIPISGSSQGYFIIESEEELEVYVDNLESRVMQITERKFAVQRAMREWDGVEDEEDDDLL